MSSKGYLWTNIPLSDGWQRLHKCGARATFVYVYLCSIGCLKGNGWGTSVASIASHCDMSWNSADLAVKALTRMGILTTSGPPRYKLFHIKWIPVRGEGSPSEAFGSPCRASDSQSRESDSQSRASGSPSGETYSNTRFSPPTEEREESREQEGLKTTPDALRAGVVKPYERTGRRIPARLQPVDSKPMPGRTYVPPLTAIEIQQQRDLLMAQRAALEAEEEETE